jgi:hypothetical protein
MGVRPAHYQKSAHGWKAELGYSAQNMVVTIPTQVEPVHNSLATNQPKLTLYAESSTKFFLKDVNGAGANS